MLSQPMPARVKVKKAMYGLELGSEGGGGRGKVRCGVGIEVKIVASAYQ